MNDDEHVDEVLSSAAPALLLFALHGKLTDPGRDRANGEMTDRWRRP